MRKAERHSLKLQRRVEERLELKRRLARKPKWWEQGHWYSKPIYFIPLFGWYHRHLKHGGHISDYHSRNAFIALVYHYEALEYPLGQ